MRIEQFNQIMKIEEHKSLSKAANDLFISQPSLSISISHLEEELCLKIFDRSNTGVMPTEQGKEVLRLAKNVLDLTEKITGIMNGKKGLIRNLQMAIPAAFANAIVPELLLQFRGLYPEVKLHINEAPFYEIADMMDKGIYSLGVVTGRVCHEEVLLKHLQDKNITCEIIRGGNPLKYALFISSKNPLADREWVSISELHNMKMISYKDLYSVMAKDLEFSVTKPIIVEDIELLKKLISENLGFSIFPQILACNDLYAESQRIKAVPIKDFPDPANIYILYSGKDTLSFIEKELLTIVREVILGRMTN